jgi:hypothetical protein
MAGAMLDDLAKPNVIVVFGAAVLSTALPALLPQWRPALKSAIKFGIILLAESEEEAEAELIQSLVETTIAAIREELAEPAGDAERGAAVRCRIRHFKHRARRRSWRWDGDSEGHGRCYRHHVRRLEVSLTDQAQRLPARDRPIIAEAVANLAQE